MADQPDQPDQRMPDHVVEKLREPNPCTVTTLRKDGTPVSVATWYLLEDDGRLLLNMDDSRVRLQHLRRDPRIAMTILDQESWYNHVSVTGRVVEMATDDGLGDIDRLARHYTGDQYPNRDDPRTSAWVEVDRWHGWGETKG